MSLNQTITAAKAKQLPESVTGGGDFGTEKGSQLVAVRIYGPTGGDIADIKVDGSAVEVDAGPAGRPARRDAGRPAVGPR